MQPTSQSRSIPRDRKLDSNIAPCLIYSRSKANSCSTHLQIQVIRRMPMEAERENFTAKTRNLIASRAGYRCSFLECDRATIGPDAAPGSTASVGVACHIFSAAPDGPRGQGGLTVEQLKSVENGFWACENHGKLIDVNKGKSFPADTLFSWRALHEARIRREMGGNTTPVKWIQSIEIVRSPLATNGTSSMFKAGERLNLSRVTLLMGDNAIGKTALCDWLTAMAEKNNLSRWTGSKLCFRTTFYEPQKHILTISDTATGFSFLFDGITVPFNPLPVAIQRFGLAPTRKEAMCDVDWIAAWLDVTPDIVRRLSDSIHQQGNPFMEDISVALDGTIETKLKIEKHSFFLEQLGWGSKTMVALALSVTHANNTSLHAPTILVMDNGLDGFDTSNRLLILSELGKIERFQSIITLASEDQNLPWTGWSLVRINPGPDGARFE